MGFEIGKVTRLRLGYVGEHVARTIEIDVSSWLDRWPDALIHMTVKRPDEDDLYIPATDIENGILAWNIRQSDIAVGGIGVAQIRALDRASGACYMSRVVETIINDSMDGATDDNAPDKASGWVNQVLEAAASVADRAEELDGLVDDAGTAIEAANTAAANADQAASDAREYADVANTAASAANDAARRAETATANANSAAENAGRAASDVTSASAAANAAAAEASGAAQEANASAEHADSVASAAQAAANSASSAAGEANTAARNANSAAADARAAAQAVSAATEAAQDAANEADTAAAAASASSTAADSAAQKASSAASDANSKANAAETAANTASTAAGNANAATSAANTAATAANTAAKEATTAKNAANTAATNAETAAGNANAATNAANTAAAAAQAAAGDVDAAKAAANTAATNANEAALAAQNAASSAESAASRAMNAYSVASSAAARAEAVANMTVEAETLTPGSKATAQYKDGKLTLGIPQGKDGEGGGGMPDGEAPFQMLATGPDGTTQWVDRTHYEYPAETIIPLHDMEMQNGYRSFTEPFERIPTPGLTYHITYYGYDYDVVAEEWMDGDVRCISLGNKNLIGGDISPEPFIFVFYADNKQIFGAYGYFSCSANKDSIAVSIESVGVLKKIDPKFLPEGTGGGGLPTGGEPYKQLVTDGEGNAVWEDRLAYESKAGVVLPETELMAGGDGQFFYMGKYDATVQPGDKCVVTYNGVDYSTTAGMITEGGMNIVVLGNLGAMTGTGDSGEPFFYMVVPDDQVADLGASGMLFALDGAETVTIKITGGSSVKKVDPKFLPEGIGYETPNTLSLVLEACSIIHDPGGDYRTENPLEEDLVAGDEYSIWLDGIEYKTICKATGVSYVPFVLGNPGVVTGEDNGEPFMFFCGGKAGEYLWYGGGNNDFLQSTIEVYKGSAGSVHTISMKYLPDYLYGQDGDMSEVLQENVPVTDNSLGYGWRIEVPFTSPLVISNEYVVTYNGVEYRCKCTISGYMDCPAVGDQRLEEFPFYIVDFGANLSGDSAPSYGAAKLQDDGATISIRNGGILRKIDPKFLPMDAIAQAVLDALPVYNGEVADA